VSDQVDAQDVLLERAAAKFTTVEVPPSGQDWCWHTWLDLGRQR
jgi:hypothetical protein